MDFDITDDVKPRFQLQSGPVASEVEEKELNKVLVGVCSSVGVLLLALSWFQFGILQFLTFWLALSLLAGPFAPASLTGGSCRVGVGELLPEPAPVAELPAEPEKRTKRRPDATAPGRVSSKENLVSDTIGEKFTDADSDTNSLPQTNKPIDSPLEGDDGAWTETEDRALVSALKAFPKDTPKRWDKVADAVPGRPKAQCFKRFSELRDSFRNSKAEQALE